MDATHAPETAFGCRTLVISKGAGLDLAPPKPKHSPQSRTGAAPLRLNLPSRQPNPALLFRLDVQLSTVDFILPPRSNSTTPKLLLT